MDFTLLREEGIEHIQSMSGRIWTDYNAHDPGITILEHLCYAITDLSYRLSFDMQDLLAHPPQSRERIKQFFTANEILTTHPVTINDYRKLIIDIEGVKNCWLEPLDDPITGLYRVLIEKEADIDDERVLDKVRRKLHSHRNLCEDFVEIKILPFEEISVYAELEIEDDADVNELTAKIYFELDSFIAPSIRKYSLKELIDKGEPIDEIFEGPPLENGFIDNDELNRFDRKPELHTSDLIHILLDIRGISAVKTIFVSSFLSREKEAWALQLSSGFTPAIKDLDAILKDHDIKFYKGGIFCGVDRAEVKKKADNTPKEPTKATAVASEKDMPIPAGHFRELSDYVTVQNDFPANYGIGEVGLPDSASDARKAHAKQLQAYLMFFDQILANYFSQLNRAKDLFSPHYTENRTYFVNMLSQVPGIEDEVDTDRERLQELTEDPETALQRRNRFLDHLMARFSEKFPNHLLLLHEKLSKELLQNKLDFLKAYPGISSNRGRAFNYISKDKTWNTNNVAGLKSRICAMLGIRDHKRKHLTETDVEGFHMIEHILLRPVKRAAAVDYQPDPYSFRISFVFPDWPMRCGEENFQKLIHDVLISETAAHIAFNVLWFDRDRMSAFEDEYRQWLEKLAEGSDAADVHATALIKFLENGRVVDEPEDE